MISKSATAENSLSTKSLECFVANTFFPFNNLNSFKSGNSTLRFGLTENPVNSSTFLEMSGNIFLENDSNSVKNPLNENQIREILYQNKFQITKSTKKPSKISWNLKINDRTQLNYKVDIIIAKKYS